MADRPSQIGPFDIIEELGRGAMGVVYRAHHRELDRDFALKVVGAGVSDRPDALARFKREAQAAARLAGHPNIVGVHQIGESDGTAWFSMDLVDGESLESVINEGDLQLDEAARILAVAARAVDHAHDQSVLHRDIKPANILVGHDGEVYVTDFGLARLQDVHGDLTRITTSDLLVGTPAYMAPEQIHGERLDGRADVYSLGATLYEAITGQTPFPGTSVLSVLTKVVQEPPALPSVVVSGIPADLEAICLRALAKRPEDRYPTAILFAEELEAFLAGKPVLARRSSAVGRLGKQFRRSRHGVLLGALLGASVAGTAAVVWVAAGRGGPTQAAVQSAERGASEAELGAEMVAAHLFVVHNAAEPIETAMRVLHGEWMQQEQLDAAAAALEQWCDAAAEQYPRARAPEAWRAFARHVREHSPASYKALLALAKSPGDDPFPALLGARVALLRYAAILDDPLGEVTGDEVFVERFVEGAWLRRYRDDALACLALVTGSRHWGRVPEARDIEAFAEAAQLLVDREWEELLRTVEPMRDDPVWGVDATTIEGFALFQLGRYSDAARAWAALADRGWLDALRNVQRAFQAEVSVALQRGADPAEPSARYRQWLERIQKVQPATPHAWRVTSRGYRWLGGIARKLGADARPDYRRAIAAADRLLELNPESKWGHYLRGQVRQRIYTLGVDEGADMEATFAAARADLEESLRRTPGDTDSLQALGILYATAGDYVPDADARAGALFETAIDYFSQCIDIRRARGLPIDASNRAGARLQLAEQQAITGRYDAAVVEAALRDLAESAENFPDRLNVRDKIAAAHLFQSEQEVRQGRDGLPFLRRAVEVYDGVLAQSPLRSVTLNNRGLAWRQIGEVLKLRGQDPFAAFDRAVADARQAVARTPGDGTYHMNLASVLRSRGNATREIGGNAMPDFEDALGALGRAAELQPTSVSVFGTRGQVRTQMAKLLREVWAQAQPLFEGAIADYTRAIELSPGDPRTLANRADTYRDYADELARRGDGGRDHMRRSLEDYASALELAPRHPIILYNRAVAYERIAFWAIKNGEDARLAATNAVDDALSAVEVHPRLAPAWQLLGRLYRRASLFERAIAAYDKALEIRPGHAQYRAERERALQGLKDQQDLEKQGK